jgi:2-phosphoglycerate kinase
MFTRTPDQKKKDRKMTKLKNQNHKNQAGQQYTKYYGLWKIIMSYEKNESNKKGNSPEKQKKINKKDPMCTWRWRGTP